MGRLQRKKDPVKKRKLREKKGESLQANGGEAVAVHTAGAESARSSKRKAPPAPKKKSFVQSNQDNFIGKSIQFLREARAELKKVTWPSRKQTIGSTIVVIVAVLIISFFLGLVDILLSGLVRLVLGG